MEHDPQPAHQFNTHKGGVGDAVITKDINGIITGWSASAQHLYGYSASEIIGEPVYKLVPAHKRCEAEHLLDKIKSGQVVNNHQTQRLTKDNRLIDISLSIIPIYDSKGKIIAISKIVRDITQPSGPHKVSESEERLRLATESMGLGTWDLDIASGKIIYSGKYADILGSEEKDWTWKKFAEYVEAADMPILEKSFKRSLRNGKFFAEVRLVKRNKYNTHRWIRLHGKVFFGKIGAAKRILGTVLDITHQKTQAERLEKKVEERTLSLKKKNEELKEAEEKMRQYAAELEFQNKELEQFAYITSHDLQEPLRKICTFTDLVHQNLDDKVILGKYFNKLRESAGRMSELLKDIVDYSRLSYSDKSFGSVDLNQLMNKVADDFEMLVTEKQAEISVEPLPCITGIWGQLHQLFSNLFSNSLKFCYAKPQISVQATQPSVEEINGLEDLDKRRKYVKIEFRDNGIGFEQQYAEKIFVIFQRLNNKQFFSGTGIGLALCKKIVENHHGYISAQGRLNRGAIFNIYLPQT